MLKPCFPGSGKTAAFLIPILSNLFEGGPPEELKNGTFTSHKVTPLVLILAPTRELASQIFEMTQHLCYRSVDCVHISVECPVNVSGCVCFKVHMNCIQAYFMKV